MKKLMVIFATLALFAGSAVAADWNFYGSARVSTFYSKIDADPFNGGADTQNYEQNFQGNARIGARIKVSDQLTARFEYGALQGVANVRILWGEWNFGAGSLGIGKNYTPLLLPGSNQVYNLNGFNKGDTNMSTFGMMYGDRKAQIKLKFGGFQIAAVESNDKLAYTSASKPDTEIKLPAIQAKYGYAGESWYVAVAGGYSTYEILSNGKEYSMDSYVVGLGGRLNLGNAYLKANVWTGQNPGNQIDVLVNGDLRLGRGDGWGFGYWDGAQAFDRDGFGAIMIAGYKINEGISLEAGYGYVKTELDMDGAKKDDADSYYVQSTIFLAPGVSMTPEIGRIDMKQAGQTDITYAGIKWQINF